jgi:hypothetical protein
MWRTETERGINTAPRLTPSPPQLSVLHGLLTGVADLDKITPHLSQKFLSEDPDIHLTRHAQKLRDAILADEAAPVRTNPNPSSTGQAKLLTGKYPVRVGYPNSLPIQKKRYAAWLKLPVYSFLISRRSNELPVFLW